MTEQPQPPQHPLWSRIMAGLILVLSIIYIGNPTGGVVELLFDNLPVVGNLDEGLAAYLIMMALRYLGVRVPGIGERQE
ncbi:MAG: DUF1232 domain-containing protein [Chloroflexota bacterium]|nr:DUF1232 domain-containing protein [Chloroflexota bacterium]